MKVRKDAVDPWGMPEDQLREWTAELIERLDGLDEEDYFGSEGWQSFLMGE